MDKDIFEMVLLGTLPAYCFAWLFYLQPRTRIWHYCRQVLYCGIGYMACMYSGILSVQQKRKYKGYSYFALFNCHTIFIRAMGCIHFFGQQPNETVGKTAG